MTHMDIEQWIQKLPSLSQQDFIRLDRAVQQERDIRQVVQTEQDIRKVIQMEQARIIYTRFRKKFLPPSQDSDEDDSPGEFQELVEENLDRLTTVFQALRVRRTQHLISSAFACLRRHAARKRFRTSLLKSSWIIDVDDDPPRAE